jgi:methionine synthase I (cobalamin-dependent)
MTREEFRALLDEKVLICDGPLGVIFQSNEVVAEVEATEKTVEPVENETAEFLAEDEDLFEDGEFIGDDDDDESDDEIDDELKDESGDESGDETSAEEAPAPQLPELLALEDKTRLIELHAASIEAGADIILTNTFAANGPTLAALELEEKLEAILIRSIEAVREAVDQADLSSRRKPIIGFVMGPLAPGMAPEGSIEFAEALASYQEVAMAADGAGIDLFVLDAIPDLQMLRAALIAIRETAPDTPVLVQMAFGRDGRSESRTSPASACAVCRSLGADVIGAAGNLMPDEMLRVVTAFTTVSDLPLICQPMAMADRIGGHQSLSPQEFAAKTEVLIEKGVSIVGCWCSRKPHYVAYLKRMCEGKKPQNPQRAQRLILSSRSRDIEIGAGRGMVMIKSWDEVSRLATRGEGDWQREALRRALAPARRAGAQMFEIKQATPGLDEPEFFRRAMPIIQEVGDLPVLISADTRKGLEEALRCAAGRPLINSVWLDKDRLERILPLARKYGAAVVAVSMRGDKAPGGAEDRVTVMEELLQEIVSGGLRQEDVIVDPIMSSIERGPDELMEVLRTLTLLKEKLGQPTLIKLSRLAENIPGRSGLDAAFVAMAMTAGLDAAAGDFHESDLWQSAAASSMIMGRDPEGRRYSAFVRAQEKIRAEAAEQDDGGRRFEGRPDRSSDSRDRRPSDRDRSQGGYGDRPRPQGGYGDRPRPQSGASDRGRSQGGYGDRPRPQGGYGDRGRSQGGYGDRPRPQGGASDRGRSQGGYGDRPRPQGGYGDRGRSQGGYGDRPRPQGGSDDRGRSQGGYGDRPRPQGGYGDRGRSQGGYGDRGRSQGGYGDRPRPQGGSGDRGRSQGGYGDRPRPQGGSGDRGRSQGGYGDRPRPQGGQGGYGDRNRSRDGYQDRGRSYGGNRDRDRKPASSGDYYRDRDRNDRDGGHRGGDRPRQGGYQRRDNRDSGSRDRQYDNRRPQRDGDSRDFRPRPSGGSGYDRPRHSGGDSRDYKPRHGSGSRDSKPRHNDDSRDRHGSGGDNRRRGFSQGDRYEHKPRRDREGGSGGGGPHKDRKPFVPRRHKKK